MRISVLIGCVAFAAGLGAPALAQASFQPIEGVTGAVYWDAATLKRAGDTFEVDILQVYKPAKAKPQRGGITRHRLSCVWSAATTGVLGYKSIDAKGKVLDSSGPEPFAQGSFYGGHGWQAEIAPIVCDKSRAAAPKGLSAKQAMADGAARVARGGGDPDPKRAAPPPADTAAARFGVIREESATGNMAFLDWSRVVRTGDKATVQTLDALGDDSAPPPAMQWNFPVFALRTLVLDCKARTLRQTGYVTFSKYFDAGFADGTPWPVRRASDWPLGAQVLDAACGAKEPAQTYASRAAAIAHQREVHPIRK